MEFVDALIGHLAWPVAVVLIVFFLRHRLTELLGRLTSFEGPAGIKAQFAQQFERLEETVAEAEIDQPVPPRVQEEQKPSTDESDSLAQLSEQLVPVSPSAAVMSAWTHVEHALNGAAARTLASSKTRFTDSRYRPVRRILNDLTAEGYISESWKQAIESLFHLRNEVAHTRQVEITPTAAAIYVARVGDVVRLLDSLGPRGSTSPDS